MSKTYIFEDFLFYADKKGYDYNTIFDFMQHFQNKLSLKENLKNFNKFIEAK